ncbi:MAG: methyl-accepting chemotaxis protein [Acidobacteriota bacterium]
MRNDTVKRSLSRLEKLLKITIAKLPIRLTRFTDGLSIKHEQIIYFILIALVITVLSGFIYYQMTTASILNSVRERVVREQKGVETYFSDAYAVLMKRDLYFLNDSPLMDAFLTAQKDESLIAKSNVESLFQRFSKIGNDLYLSIRFIDYNNEEQIVVSENRRVKNYINLSQPPAGSLFYEKLATLFNRLRVAKNDSILFEGPFQDQNKRKTFLIGIAKRDPEAQGFGGALILHADLTRFFEYLSNIKINDRPITWVYSPDNQILFAPSQYQNDFNLKVKLAEGKVKGDWVVLSNNCRIGSDERVFLQIFFSAPPEIYQQERFTAIWSTLLLCTLAILFSSLLAFFFSQRITNPVVMLSSIVQKVSEGDLGINAVLSHQRKEIEILLSSFNTLVNGLCEITNSIEYIAKGDLRTTVAPRSQSDTLGLALQGMVLSLRAIVSRVRDCSQQVKTVSVNLASSSQQLEKDSDTVAGAVQDMALVVSELSNNIRETARRVESQTTSVGETAIAVELMAGRLAQIAKNTKNLTNVVDTVGMVVNNGRHAVEQAAGGMHEINSSITKTAQVIEALGEQANTIGAVVGVIDTISDRTNLLALNAAIEAARAGSHGLGFGVVAEEVRKLSERTAQSAEEINQLISAMQQSVRQAVEQMGRSTYLVQEGIDQSTKVVHAFSEIQDVVADVATTSNDIDKVINEQMIGTEQVLVTAEKLSGITHEIQVTTAEQAASTTELIRSVERVSDAAERNARLSESLAGAGRSVLLQSRRLEEVVSIFQLSETPQESNMFILN